MTEAAASPTELDRVLASAVRIVTPCAVFPIAFGVIAFVGWFACYWNFWVDGEKWFIAFGAGTLLLGLISFLIGSTVLISRIYTARQLATDNTRRRVFTHAGFLGTLLIANFPVAFFLATAAFGMAPRVMLHIDNQTNRTIKDIKIQPDNAAMPSALGGRVTRQRFMPQRRGKVIVTGVLNDTTIILWENADYTPGLDPVRIWTTVASPKDVETTLRQPF